MSTKILGNEELNILRAKTPYSLPDNPSDKGFNARQIKTKFWEGYLLLFNWLKETQASLNNDFATTNSALLNESKRIDVILTYFSDGKANIAIKDRNNNIIDETYELKSEASTKFNQLIADIQSVSSASGNKITGSQNINADGIQYTITLSNTQNATLSTITQYLPLATTLKAGLLSSTDKEKLNNLESDLTNFLANAKAYTDEKLQRDNIVNILGAASHTLIGLLTSEDKKKIDALYALLGEAEDADTVVNTINEVLAIFSSYPEGVDIVSQLEKKVNYTDVINTLDSEETSKPLSAKMGKELKTEVDTKAELSYVNEELDKKALKSDILIIEEAVTAQESEITTTQNEGDKLVDEIVGYVDGSPRGVYASLSALQSAFPSGAQGVYVCSDNGHWYYWSGTAWTDGGVYQSSEDINKLKEDLVELKTDLNYEKGSVNLLNEEEIDFNNKIITGNGFLSNDNRGFRVYVLDIGVGNTVTVSTDQNHFYGIQADGNTIEGEYNHIKDVDTTTYFDTSSQSTKTVKTITMSHRYLWLCFFHQAGDSSLSAYTSKIMVNSGESALPYEPYKIVINFDIEKYNNLLDLSVYEQAYIKNCELVANYITPAWNGAVAQYTGAKMTGKVISVKARVKFYGSAFSTFISEPNGLYSVNDVINKCVHINMSRAICYVGYFDGRALTNTKEIQFAPNSINEGEEVAVGFDINTSTNTITVYLPNGNTYTETNAKYTECAGEYAMWEHYKDDASSSFVCNHFTKIYAKDVNGKVLCDDFKRKDGAIGIAPQGYVYGQFTNLNQTTWEF